MSSNKSWTLCTEHLYVVKEQDHGSCPECNGDRNCIVVVPAKELEGFKASVTRLEFDGPNGGYIVQPHAHNEQRWVICIDEYVLATKLDYTLDEAIETAKKMAGLSKD